MAILTAPNIRYDYTNRCQTGQLYAIIGKSGSGKTTFFSLPAGLDAPTGNLDMETAGTAPAETCKDGDAL